MAIFHPKKIIRESLKGIEDVVSIDPLLIVMSNLQRTLKFLPDQKMSEFNTVKIEKWRDHSYLIRLRCVLIIIILNEGSLEMRFTGIRFNE